jgi:hypothetical protein
MKKVIGVAVASIAALGVAACGTATSTTQAPVQSSHSEAQVSKSQSEAASESESASESKSQEAALAKIHATEKKIHNLKVCGQGRTEIEKFLADFKPIGAQLDAGATQADTTQAQKDLKPVAQTLTTLDHLATSQVDHTDIETVQHGIGALDAGLNDIQYGDMSSALTSINEGDADIEGFGKLDICVGT